MAMTLIMILLLLLFFYGLVSHRLERTIITGPMMFAAAGILVFFAWPGLAEVEVKSKTVLVLSEIALALVLFTNASRMHVRAVLRNAQLPTRLLGIGMPFTILTGAVAAALLLTDLTVWEAAILAVILAPTDAGLGQVVVNSPLVPKRIREALDVEAGLNDGLSVPLLMLFIALAQTEHPLQESDWIAFTAAQIGFGLLVGLVVGWVGGWLMGRATRRGWMAETSHQLGLLALAVACWFFAEEIGGNGFIAAFAGGLVVKLAFEGAGERMLEFTEAWGQLLNLFVFYIFGMLAGPLLRHFDTVVVLYALLSLTVIRMLPVAIALVGARLRPASVLFLGWFGPRGLASVVLGLMFLEEQVSLPGEPVIVGVVTATVLFSVFAHGITAAPATRLVQGRWS